MRTTERAGSIADGRTRSTLVATIAGRMADHDWAFQGDTAAPSRWAAAEDNGDLDLWVHRDSARAMAEMLRGLGGVLLASATDRGRLQHDQWWLPTVGRDRDGGIVDVTVGDLRVGAILLLTEADVHTSPFALAIGKQIVRGRRFTGAAAIADLALRPLLRGRLVGGARRELAQHFFDVVSRSEPALVRSMTQRAVGRRLLDDALAWLGGDDSAGGQLVSAARRKMTSSALCTPLATWRQRWSILPGGARPFGLRTTGVVVALVGTDGAGKSTVADGVSDQLARAGVRVERRYFGMARGNARWLTALRKRAGGGSVAVDLSGTSSLGASSPATSSPSLTMRLASYAYGVDYVWRVWRTVSPLRRRGAVVLCDRWVTDLRRHPVPGTWAARLTEWIVGRPQIIVLADAPVEQIVARKPERTLEDAAHEQQSLRSVGESMHGRSARGGGRTVFHIADTSGPIGEAEALLVSRIIEALHRQLH